TTLPFGARTFLGEGHEASRRDRPTDSSAPARLPLPGGSSDQRPVHREGAARRMADPPRSRLPEVCRARPRRTVRPRRTDRGTCRGRLGRARPGAGVPGERPHPARPHARAGRVAQRPRRGPGQRRVSRGGARPPARPAPRRPPGPALPRAHRPPRHGRRARRGLPHPAPPRLRPPRCPARRRLARPGEHALLPRHPHRADGVAARRRYGFQRGALTGFEDEALTAPGPGAESSAILEAEIERPRTGPMRDIVATIQPEQDVIVRSGIDRTVVVQGAPGTGKTAVRLHRAAYLLYSHRERVSRAGMTVVGPNASFLRYIRDVLPALGEVDATQTTVEQI